MKDAYLQDGKHLACKFTKPFVESAENGIGSELPSIHFDLSAHL